jgi:hypothetical protein
MADSPVARFDALNSQGWYLDHIKCDWSSMYNNDPAYGVDSNATHRVLGGQGEMCGSFAFLLLTTFEQSLQLILPIKSQVGRDGGRLRP